MDTHIFDLIVVGAGLSGIIAAQRYLDAHPDCKLAILEKDGDIGGVFSRRRVYHNFWTQWTVGLSEFSDMPMQRPPEQDCHHDFYKAKYTTNYLEQYVDRKDKNGQKLRDRIVSGINVQLIRKVDGEWHISCSSFTGIKKRFRAQKLMVASGLTSTINMPKLPGSEQFGGPIIHSEDFGASGEAMLASDGIKKITVLGAGKSAADMVYEAVKLGKEVSWIIRTTGGGAAFFVSGKGRGGFKNAFEAGAIRAAATVMPSIFNPLTYWTQFLHSTTIGNWLVKRMMAALDADIRKTANYKGRQSDKNFKDLEYDTPFFWQSGPGGLLHHDDFWNTIANNVFIYRDDVQSLDKGIIHLASGKQIQSDAILCGTGWKPSIEFFEGDLLVKLELPHDPAAEPAATTQKWAKLTQDADEKICADFPILANPPPHAPSQVSTTPYRLYQGMAPLHDDTILMMNHIVTGNKMLAAEMQAMWAVAYFDKRIALPSVEDMEKDIALWTAWSRRRYLASAELGNNIAFETITYADRLLKEMGLSAHKKGSWWKNQFEPNWPRDWGRAWAEYLAGGARKREA